MARRTFPSAPSKRVPPLSEGEGERKKETPSSKAAGEAVTQTAETVAEALQPSRTAHRGRCGGIGAANAAAGRGGVGEGRGERRKDGDGREGQGDRSRAMFRVWLKPSARARRHTHLIVSRRARGVRCVHYGCVCVCGCDRRTRRLARIAGVPPAALLSAPPLRPSPLFSPDRCAARAPALPRRAPVCRRLLFLGTWVHAPLATHAHSCEQRRRKAKVWLWDVGLSRLSSWLDGMATPRCNLRWTSRCDSWMLRGTRPCPLEVGFQANVWWMSTRGLPTLDI